MIRMFKKIPNLTQTKQLMLSTLDKFSADNILKYFSYFFPENRIWHFIQIISNGENLHEISNPVFWEKSQETGFGISCKLSSMETIWMKFQILFSGKNKKNIITKDCQRLTKSLSVYLYVCKQECRECMYMWSGLEKEGSVVRKWWGKICILTRCTKQASWSNRVKPMSLHVH